MLVRLVIILTLAPLLLGGACAASALAQSGPDAAAQSAASVSSDARHDDAQPDLEPVELAADDSADPTGRQAHHHHRHHHHHHHHTCAT